MNIKNKFPLRAGRWASSSQASHARSGAKTSSKSNSTPIRVNGKVIGEVRGAVFVKTVRRQKHFFQKHNGYSFSVDSLIQAKQAGACFIEIRETDTGDIFNVSMEVLHQKGIRLPDEGYGRQICLPIEHWTKSHKSTWNQLSFGW